MSYTTSPTFAPTFSVTSMSSAAAPTFAPTAASSSGSQILSTFLAAIKSVGAVYVIAAAGIYLHRRKFLSKNGKRDLSHIYLQLALPLLFFTQFIYCEHDVAADSCPDITKYLGDVWILLLWPFWVNGAGLAVGWLCAKVAKVPSCQTKAISTVVGFASSTSLPVSLLTAIRYNTAADSIDPVLFLGVYLILPVQFMFGGWLLKPSKADECHSESLETDTDVESAEEPQRAASNIAPGESECDTDENDSTEISVEISSDDDTTTNKPLPLRIMSTIRPFFPPPVVGALLGIFVAIFPKLRNIFVDLEDRDESAPLEWMFDSLWAIGQIAVPLNLFVLGWSLSNSLQKKKDDSDSEELDFTSGHSERLFTRKAMIAVVIGKMIVIPLIGIASAFLLHLVYTVPQDIANSFYLVILIVFITPSNNAVLMMIEASGLKCQEGVSRVISIQYLIAPVVLSFSVMATVYMADLFSS